ncbi:MAG: hypothetical protein K2G05_04185, partial [Duncaniella sp.]|nr:hypothetical protein [Duncaniella sp.]
MTILILVILAVIALAAIWRATTVSRTLADIKSENTSLKIEAERRRNASEIELATARQALQSMTAAKSEAEVSASRRIEELTMNLRNTTEA